MRIVKLSNVSALTLENGGNYGVGYLLDTIEKVLDPKEFLTDENNYLYSIKVNDSSAMIRVGLLRLFPIKVKDFELARKNLDTKDSRGLYFHPNYTKKLCRCLIVQKQTYVKSHWHIYVLGHK